MQQVWTTSSWKNKQITQQPVWPDIQSYERAVKQLSSLPPLVFAGEARQLTNALAAAAGGKAFLLQAGDCSESFADISADAIRDKLKVILQMAIVLTYAAGVPVVKVGRIAGQFAKPRTSATETVNGVEIPSFRGHMVNDDTPTLAARTPDPNRLLTAYHHSAATLNLLRAFTKGGFADLSSVHNWNLQFVASSPQGKRYETLANEIDRALKFMAACGISLSSEATLHQVDFWTSHEALILGYEEALSRKDSLTGDFYDCSAHMLWVGERTHQTDGGHIEFLSGIHNPIGCKIGPSTTQEEIVEICKALNPKNIPGRLTLITRIGANKVVKILPPLIKAVKDSGQSVLWACDPMHANTFLSDQGLKTRHFDDIITEIEGFFSVHEQQDTWPGGIHIELTGDAVTECLGGGQNISEEQLDHSYTTTCDPRLNAQQAIDLAFELATLLKRFVAYPTLAEGQ